MLTTNNRDDFWQALDALLPQSQLVIDRPRGFRHPRFTDFIYPLDYGYLEGTLSADGEGLDVWLGVAAEGKSLADCRVCGVIASVDLDKRDAELKLLLDCSDEEMLAIEKIYNRIECIRGLLIVRH
ncbi:inorganic pyrophosphatase [Formivibrio citricus]|uniref:inorganic diphosphatase n=1 Tax=Formivibrio citricus TaxID=83765 RepID=A0A1I4YJU6_9NEIS|nr:inorganic diphosphatase [Formivibrio citricus]SFN38284.1 inorganic pyrophosphatase [Formivibrio citricus]